MREQYRNRICAIRTTLNTAKIWTLLPYRKLQNLLKYSVKRNAAVKKCIALGFDVNVLKKTVQSKREKN